MKKKKNYGHFYIFLGLIDFTGYFAPWIQYDL